MLCKKAIHSRTHSPRSTMLECFFPLHSHLPITYLPHGKIKTILGLMSLIREELLAQEVVFIVCCYVESYGDWN